MLGAQHLPDGSVHVVDSGSYQKTYEDRGKAGS
jgi:hypothetical protein